MSLCIYSGSGEAGVKQFTIDLTLQLDFAKYI